MLVNKKILFFHIFLQKNEIIPIASFPVTFFLLQSFHLHTSVLWNDVCLCNSALATLLLTFPLTLVPEVFPLPSPSSTFDHPASIRRRALYIAIGIIYL